MSGFLPYLVSKIYRGGAHLYFRLDIILIKGLSKHTLNTYFSGMKIDPKYPFLQAFFLIFPSCPFKNLSLWPKRHPFFQFCMFCTPKWCTLIHCLVLKNDPNYVNFFYNDIHIFIIQVPPPPKKNLPSSMKKTNPVVTHSIDQESWYISSYLIHENEAPDTLSITYRGRPLYNFQKVHLQCIHPRY